MDIQREIVKIGNSKGIIISPDLLSYLNLDVGDAIIIRDDVNKRGQKFVSFFKASD